MARQKRGVHIKDAVRRNIYDLLRDDFSVGGNDDNIGSPCLYSLYRFRVP